MSRRLKAAAVLAVLLLVAGAARAEDDAWAPLRFLVGTWEGTSAGFGQEAPVRHAWSFVLGGTFLRLETTGGDAGVERGDVGYVSRDTDHGRFVFRQFLSEGFVNTYDLAFPADRPGTVVFEHRETESAGGVAARLVLTPTAPDAYTMTLELAMPGKDFAACQTTTMKRTQP